MPIQGASRRWHQASILRPVSRDRIQRCARSAALRRLNPPLSKGTRCRTEALQLIAGKQRNAKWPAPLQGTSRAPAPLQAEQIFYLRCQGEQADRARPNPQTGSSLRKKSSARGTIQGQCRSRTRARRWPDGRSRWWAGEDLNLRPHAYQACALTT